MDLKEYFRENWGAPFIIVFMVLLIVAAVFLGLGFEFLAERLAEFAYYFLVVGVVLQLVVVIKEERSEDKGRE